MCHNYIGHNYTDHNYTGHNYIGALFSPTLRCKPRGCVLPRSISDATSFGYLRDEASAIARKSGVAVTTLECYPGLELASGQARLHRYGLYIDMTYVVMTKLRTHGRPCTHARSPARLPEYLHGYPHTSSRMRTHNASTHAQSLRVGRAVAPVVSGMSRSSELRATSSATCRHRRRPVYCAGMDVLVL